MLALNQIVGDARNLFAPQIALLPVPEAHQLNRPPIRMILSANQASSLPLSSPSQDKLSSPDAIGRANLPLLLRSQVTKLEPIYRCPFLKASQVKSKIDSEMTHGQKRQS